MDKRVLVGCIAALGTMLGVDLLAEGFGWRLDLPVPTGLGILPVGSVVTTLVAMTLGGWIARRRFDAIAVALTAVVWIATIVALVAMATPGATGMSLPDIVRFNALAILFGLLAAWLGARLGERLAMRGPAQTAT